MDRSSGGPGAGETRDLRQEVTTLLAAGEDGAATDRLLEVLYDELHALAGGYLARERADHTLQPTALVHEAYLRLLGDGEVEWRSKRGFLASAARAMRRYLVDHARGKRRDKRGGGWNRVELTGIAPQDAPLEVDLVELDEALEELTQLFEREARVVELRFFAGLTTPQVAEVLEVTTRTVERDWRHARAWLLKRLG